MEGSLRELAEYRMERAKEMLDAAKGILERNLSVIIKHSAFLREKSDYDDFFIASKKDAEKQLKDAELFLEKLEIYLNQNRN